MNVIDLDTLPPETLRALEARAERHARNLEDEIRAILARAALEKETGLGDQLREIFVRHDALIEDFPLPKREIHEPMTFE